MGQVSSKRTNVLVLKKILVMKGEMNIEKVQRTSNLRIPNNFNLSFIIAIVLQLKSN